ncbi:hypothetical protein NC651_016286 [Populus alba x Populus x berolinensis]|nr:hypothetical protein NC651_016286 [Populus alba x Populus x berolinensis]
MSRESMSMIIKSIGHSTCLADPLTFLSRGYKIDHRSEDVFTSNEIIFLIYFFNLCLIYLSLKILYMHVLII